MKIHLLKLSFNCGIRTKLFLNKMYTNRVFECLDLYLVLQGTNLEKENN